MPKVIFTKEMIEVVKEKYPIQSNSELASCLGVYPIQVKQLAIRLGLKKQIKFYKKTWTDKQDLFLINNYQNSTASEIAKCLGKSKSSIKSRCFKLGLKLLNENKTAKRLNQFKKGQTAYNKGQKMKPEAYEKCKHTFFKKGQESNNKKPVGSTRITDGYIMVKIDEPNKWNLLHRIVYEKCYGEIPENHNVNFKDGNRLNCEPENLYCLSKEEQMLKNSIQNLPEELISIIRLKGQLKKQITIKTRKNG